MNEQIILEKLKSAKKLIKNHDYAKGFALLNEVSASQLDFTLQNKIARLFSDIPKDFLNLQKVRIAILATSTVDHLIQIFQYWLSREGLEGEFYISEYDTVRQTILDTSSALYNFKPEIIWIFSGYRDVALNCSPGASKDNTENSINSAIAQTVSLWDTLQQNLPSYIIQNNADIPNQRIFGNHEGSVHWSRLNTLRQYNIRLSENVRQGVALFDLDFLSSCYGKNAWSDLRFWHHSKHAFSLDALGLVSFQAARLMGTLKGNLKKCLVLDLDNTLWGGVIGDDGIEGIRLGDGVEGEAFVEFQKYLISLKRRGILLTVCSKNEDSAAQLPFLEHPDMQLRLEDIALFVANWDNKAENILKIADTLNIGLDSLVFIDDNPAERDLVKKFVPEVNVIELPEDPSEFINCIDRELLFETLAYSPEDAIKTKQYRENANREQFKNHFDNIDAYLSSLEMESEVGEINDFYLPRICQLFAKSNQFNLTTIRYTESEILSLRNSKEHVVRYFKLKDRFGDNGLISTLVLHSKNGILSINNWVMSCRVLSRGMEEFICDDIISIAHNFQCRSIIGKYIPSKKNKLVSKLYERLGFTLKQIGSDQSTLWELNLEHNQPSFSHCIKKI